MESTLAAHYDKNFEVATPTSKVKDETDFEVEDSKSETVFSINKSIDEKEEDTISAKDEQITSNYESILKN